MGLGLGVVLPVVKQRIDISAERHRDSLGSHYIVWNTCVEGRHVSPERLIEVVDMR